MKFALFYEIPVARPWDKDSERIAYRNTFEQAVFGDEMGFHAFWTVEHHFLEEFSHCSNPEVLYGAIASRTENIRLGYGVRLAPKPYNHPVLALVLHLCCVAGGSSLGGLKIIDFSNPTTPFVAGATSNQFGLSAVEIDRDLAIAADFFFVNAVPIFDIGTSPEDACV